MTTRRPPIRPNGAWMILSDAKLIELLHQPLTDEECDLIHAELETRQRMREDPRVAEALGTPWLKPT